MVKEKDSKDSSNTKPKPKSEMGFCIKRTPSLESTASVSSESNGRFTATTCTDDPDRESGAMRQYGQHLCDVVVAVVLCTKHKKVCLSKVISSKGLWLPFAPLTTGQGWYDSIVAKLREVLSVQTSGRTSNKSYLSFKAPEMLHIFRLQVPQYLHFVTRVTFVTELTYDPKYPTNCCENSKNVIWVPYCDLSAQRIKELWGPEATVFVLAITSGQIAKGTYTEYTIREGLKFSPRDPPKTYQEELLKSAGFQEKHVLKVFSDFIQHCYPSQYMSYYSFVDYMTKIGLSQANSSGDEMTAYFRAFGFSRNAFLSFHEFLLGLAAMDKNTVHGGHSGELRCGYIFRYYSVMNNQIPADQTAYLQYEDLKNLTRDILKLKSPQVDESKVESELKNNYQILGVRYKDKVEEKVFVRCVGSMQLRGTSGLFRSSVSPLQQIRLKRPYDPIELIESTNTGIDSRMQRAKATCQRCREKKYTLAIHTVRLLGDCTVVEPQVNKDLSDLSRIPRNLRKMSDMVFLQSTTANQIIDSLRTFADSLITNRSNSRQQTSDSNVWASKSGRTQLLDNIMKICSDSESMLRNSARVVKVCSPCYVLGDIHGNFHDLMVYETLLWKAGPTCLPANYLFLGDYVDRGEYGLECILYLLSYKLLAPDKFCLLRGNHELRAVQQKFTFHRECQDKFGNKYGLQIWEALNKVFDLLPICAIIDDSIFCAHGGIPTSVLKIEECMKIPQPLSEPENQSPPAWQMLWNDPVSNQEFGEYSEMIRAQSGSTCLSSLPGFLPNTKRGTAYYFSEEAVDRFLSANGLSHVIRAHEVIPTGFQLHMGGKVITIFSSSKYCGGLNESACAFVDMQKIRIIKIDTNELKR